MIGLTRQCGHASTSEDLYIGAQCSISTITASVMITIPDTKMETEKEWRARRGM